MKGNKRAIRCSVCFLECFVWSGHKGSHVCFYCEQKRNSNNTLEKQNILGPNNIELPDWVAQLIVLFDDGEDLYPEKRVTRYIEQTGIPFTFSDE